MLATDTATHRTLVSYHADTDQYLGPPQATRAEVESEMLMDEWTDLVTGNGTYVPLSRQGRSRRAPRASGAQNDYDQ